MPKYKVELSAKIFITVEDVEAESPEEAESLAHDYGSLSGYVGNNAYNKLVGVSHHCASVCASDDLATDSIEEM